MYLFPRAALTKYYTPGSLKQQTFIVSVLEVRSPKSRCQYGHAPLEGSREESSLPLVASDGGLQSLAFLGAPGASFQPLPLLSHGILPVCLCLQVATFSSYKDTSHIELRGHLNDHILT